MSDYQYVGSELALFSKAENWKQYFSTKLAPYIEGDVLEVGAGIGGTTPYLINSKVRQWTAMEPDAGLAAQLRASLSTIQRPSEVHVGTTHDLKEECRFDTILYIDVLEHIAADQSEVRHASERLKPGGRLIILSPAHPVLYSAFDKAVGHERRYTRSTLSKLTPVGAKLERLFSLDALGTVLSLGNRLLLRQSVPTPSQIAFWDRRVVPISRWVDPIVGFRLGRSIIAVWRKSDA